MKGFGWIFISLGFKLSFRMIHRDMLFQVSSKIIYERDEWNFNRKLHTLTSFQFILLNWLDEFWQNKQFMT